MPGIILCYIFSNSSSSSSPSLSKSSCQTGSIQSWNNHLYCLIWRTLTFAFTRPTRAETPTPNCCSDRRLRVSISPSRGHVKNNHRVHGYGLIVFIFVTFLTSTLFTQCRVAEHDKAPPISDGDLFLLSLV